MFDFGEIVNKALEFVLETIIDGLFSVMAGWIANLAASAALVLEMPIVENAIAYTQVLATSILVVKVAFDALTTYILRTSGDVDADPGGVLIRTGQTVLIIFAVPWLLKNVYIFGSEIAQDISKLSGVDYKPATNPLELMWNSYTVTSSLIPFAVGIIFAIVMLAIVMIQSFIRAGELAVLAVSGALMALSLSSDNGGGLFSTWWKELLVISLTQATQIFLLKLAFGALTNSSNADNLAQFYSTNNPLTSLMLFLGILWVTIKAPSVLKQYIHSTGTGRAAGQVGNMVMMRKIITRGR